MIVKMMITFDYDPATNEYTPLKQEVIKDKEKDPAIALANSAKDSAEPQITLADNKYILNTSAAQLLDAKWEDRIDIKYRVVDKLTFPIIGKNTTWGFGSGNKLTKSLTVSCRGNANSVLSEYGDTFSMVEWKGHEGLFILIGNNDRVNQDDNVEIKEDVDDDSDSEEINLDLEDEQEPVDDNNFEITNKDFKLN